MFDLRTLGFGLLRRCVRADADTSSIVDLIVPWRSICFLIFLNWFRHTEAESSDTSIVLCSCGISPRNLSVIPECFRNVPYLSQFPDCLVALALAIPSEASRLLLAMISRRQRS